MRTKYLLAFLAVTATALAQSVSITLGPYGPVGSYAVSSDDGFIASVATGYAPASRQGNSILTFCLEFTEVFNGHPYAYAISDAAVRGGETVSDPISVGTGYLYSLFATGTLPGYANDAASASALQAKFWQLEGEQPAAPNPFDSLLVGAFGSVTAAGQTTYGGQTAASYGVRVINVGSPPQFAGQDQLIYQVPEIPLRPRDVGIAAMVLCLAGWMGKARRNRS